MGERSQLLNWIESEQSTIISFVQEFIRCKSPNPPGDTTEAVHLIKSLLDEHKIPFRIVAPQPKMPNIVSTFDGAGPGKHLVLNGHIDVFPVSKEPKKEGWSVEPWSGDIVEGKIYGRGACDMKCGTSASIWTYIFLHRIKNKLNGRLTLTCVSDEETFGPWGSRWLIDNETEVLGDCCLNGEPSSPYTIRYGEKGLLWLSFLVTTVGSHGAYTHASLSATRLAAKLICELEELEKIDFELPKRLNDFIQQSSSALDKGMGKGASGIVDKVTLNIGTISGGLKNNMVPGQCRFEADIRLPVGGNKNLIMDRIESILSHYPNVSMVENMYNPPSHCDPEGDMVAIIKKNVMEIKGFSPTPVISLGGTDARLWRYKGIPAYVYGPSPTGMGSANENVPIEDYMHVVKTHILSAFDYLRKNV